MTIAQCKAARRKTKHDPRWRNKVHAHEMKARAQKEQAKAAAKK